MLFKCVDNMFKQILFLIPSGLLTTSACAISKVQTDKLELLCKDYRSPQPKINNITGTFSNNEVVELTLKLQESGTQLKYRLGTETGLRTKLTNNVFVNDGANFMLKLLPKSENSKQTLIFISESLQFEMTEK